MKLTRSGTDHFCQWMIKRLRSGLHMSSLVFSLSLFLCLRREQPEDNTFQDTDSRERQANRISTESLDTYHLPSSFSFKYSSNAFVHLSAFFEAQANRFWSFFCFLFTSVSVSCRSLGVKTAFDLNSRSLSSAAAFSSSFWCLTDSFSSSEVARSCADINLDHMACNSRSLGSDGSI
ncbi:uncharacterized protein LOC113314144 isoform X1 [Papaver somniferum]|uniref:uncharacterized protein LOC113314144 isoform X1 n=1 Tax=Papaver somniferum TaxID=3469 RepID=UPI000E6FD263|nr:uncharacterized protein LOC113314144 isoform X1 [Papaver somniferum]XP_026418693.1 uncharacterized protein LOC113314144 isoform X1 [Papaver somniferum]